MQRMPDAPAKGSARRNVDAAGGGGHLVMWQRMPAPARYGIVWRRPATSGILWQ